MKKMKLTFLFTFLLSMVGIKASAHDIEVANADGVTIYYNYINDGKELEVTNYKGFTFAKYSGNVVIPEEVTYMGRTRKVTSIGEYAFDGCLPLTSVIIPNSVISIGGGAFYNCKGLTSVTIPNSVTSIGEYAFDGCSGLTSVTIPNSVTSIGKKAFNECLNLQQVIVKDIAAWCKIQFSRESNPLSYSHRLYSDENTEITNLIIPDGVTTIGEYAFSYCSGLTSVTIPNSVTTIGGGAFYSCSGLTSVTIPNSVTSIGKKAFLNCTGLTSVTIPNSVTTIGIEAFAGCSGLTSVTIPNSVTTIGESAFSGCSGLTSVTIPNSVTTIGGGAFSYCSGLTSVVSQIEDPFRIYENTFPLDVFMNATLYVPKGTMGKYMNTEGWIKFVFIEEGTGGVTPTPEPQKCQKPTISYQNGKLTFSCDTEGATCQYTIDDSDIKSGSGDEVKLDVTYNISVYATKAGYNNSETATATLCWIDSSPKMEGIVNGLGEVKARALLIKNEGGNLAVEGADDGEQVHIYTTNGVQAGSAISKNGKAVISTNLQKGEIAIVKVGEKSVKVVVK